MSPVELVELFSSSMFAVPTPPTSQPARVNGTHGAGVVWPVSVIMFGFVSLVGSTGFVQYLNELVKFGLFAVPGSSRSCSTPSAPGGPGRGRSASYRIPPAVCEIRIVWSFVNSVPLCFRKSSRCGICSQIGRDVRVVAVVVDVVELEVDHVLDAVRERALAARPSGAGPRCGAVAARAGDLHGDERGESAAGSADGRH